MVNILLLVIRDAICAIVNGQNDFNFHLGAFGNTSLPIVSFKGSFLDYADDYKL